MMKKEVTDIVNNGIFEQINKAIYLPKIFCSDGIRFRVGLVDIIPNCFLSVSCSEVIFGDGSHYPTIIFSKEDLEFMLQKYNKSMVSRMLRFVIGHELGHIKEWITNPPTEKGFIADESAEIRADLYSITHTNSCVVEYKEFMGMLKDGTSKCISAVAGNTCSKIIGSLAARMVLSKRTKSTVEELRDESSCITFDLVYDDIVDKLLDK